MDEEDIKIKIYDEDKEERIKQLLSCKSEAEGKSVKLLHKYLNLVTTKSIAHKKAEKWYSKANRMLGFPPVILSTLVSILGGIEYSNANNNISIVVVSISGLCALISGSNSYLNYAKRASSHHESSGHYADIKSDIDIFLNSEYTITELVHFLNIQHEKIDIYETLESNIHESFMEKK